MFDTDSFPCSFNNAGCPPLLHNGVSKPHCNRFWMQVVRHSEQFHSMTPAHLLCPTVPSQIVPCLCPELLRHRSVMRHRERLCIGRGSVKMSVSTGRCTGCCIKSVPFESRSAYHLAAWLCHCRLSLDTAQRFLPNSLIGPPTSRALSPQWHKATHAKVATVRKDFRIGEEIYHHWSTQQTGTASDRRSGLLPSPGA